MKRRLLGSAGAALILAIVLHLMSTAAHSAAVTIQTAPFHVTGTLPAVCFQADVDSALATDDLSPEAYAAAASLLDAALSFAVVDFDAIGALQIKRHGNNGAVFHLDWGALLTQASLSFTATTTNALAAAYAEAIANSSSSSITTGTCPFIGGTCPRFGGSATALAGAGAFALAGASASGVAGSGSLAAELNLASVDAKNITEAWNGIVFTSGNFAFAKSESEAGVDISSLAGVLTAAARWNNFIPGADADAASADAAAQAAAKAVAKALARARVLAAIGGHYKAMTGPASQTDILKAGGVAWLNVQCGADVNLTVTATASAN